MTFLHNEFCEIENAKSKSRPSPRGRRGVREARRGSAAPRRSPPRPPRDARRQPARRPTAGSVTRRVAAGGEGRLGGFEEFARRAAVPAAKARLLEAEVLAAGALHVRELSTTDWESLGGWGSLGVFERRRILGALHSEPVVG